MTNTSSDVIIMNIHHYHLSALIIIRPGHFHGVLSLLVLLARQSYSYIIAIFSVKNVLRGLLQCLLLLQSHTISGVVIVVVYEKLYVYDHIIMTFHS